MSAINDNEWKEVLDKCAIDDDQIQNKILNKLSKCKIQKLRTAGPQSSQKYLLEVLKPLYGEDKNTLELDVSAIQNCIFPSTQSDGQSSIATKDRIQKLEKNIEALLNAQNRNQTVTTVSINTHSSSKAYEAMLNIKQIKNDVPIGHLISKKISFDYTSSKLDDHKTKWLNLKTNWLAKKGEITEDEHQHPVFEKTFESIINLCTPKNYKFMHTFRKGFLNGLKPDFAVFKSGHPSTALNCTFVIELLLAINIDTAHIGKTMLYNQHLLEANPIRPHAISFVTNMDSVIVVKSINRSETTSFQHFQSEEIPLWPTGFEYMCTFFNNPDQTGFMSESSISFEVNNARHYTSKFIGCGSTATVLEFQRLNKRHAWLSSGYAVKVFKTSDEYNNEKTIMSKVPKNDRFLKLIESNDINMALVITPIGFNITKLTRSRVKQMFECVRQLRAACIIHRDLSPLHFLEDSERRVFLIDFGSAIYIEPVGLNETNSKTSSYVGSFQFAAKSILEGMQQGSSSYIPSRKHDVESLVRSLMYFYYENVKIPLMKEAASVLEFWTNFDNKLEGVEKEFWSKALDLARQNNTFDDLEEHFLTKMFYIHQDIV